MSVTSNRPAPDRDDLLYLNCPRCGLSITPRAPWLRAEHCPRCLARSRTLVTLFTSTLPTSELYPKGSAPGDATTNGPSAHSPKRARVVLGGWR